MSAKHNWQRFTHVVDVHGKQQEAKTCAACGMERTRDFSTASLYLFRAVGKDWSAYRAGFIPACKKATP